MKLISYRRIAELVFNDNFLDFFDEDDAFKDAKIETISDVLKLNRLKKDCSTFLKFTIIYSYFDT